ncbi:hypothetical protein [Nocardia cerradoensis]|uniref:Uncharacterized protein n=1 Tax=Nocardia cerradoensis TaxID=85688 RepID=A0A231GST8_9NOCA|nr:hypothetical protein [Nocardia cerradoensis]NKY48049.1 hypothetical protein [Nocardia cerradoensis]OXR39689.1 hypothetical protein B7C42_08235 [Nocardia cerradoensis]
MSWSDVIKAVPPFALGALLIALYNLYLKHREMTIHGWHVVTERSHTVTNGWRDAAVTFRVMGPHTMYEINVHGWGDIEIPEDYAGEIPKMTSESDPIRLELTYRYDPDEDGPWVGVVWTEASRLGVVEHGARINLLTSDYERWQWHHVRNFFRPWRKPTGGWHPAAEMRARRTYQVPTDS